MLTTPIEQLPGTSVLTVKRLKAAGINTYWDLLNYFPFRHEDRTATTPIFSLQPGDHVTVSGTVTDVKNEFTRRGMKIQKVKLVDDTGAVTLTWFNQYYIVTTIKPGMKIAAWGAVKTSGNAKTLIPQEYEILEENGRKPLHMFRLVPIYSAKRGLSSKTIREKIWYAVTQLQGTENKSVEFLPNEILAKYDLIPEIDAYLTIHFPSNAELLRHAKTRLSFDELFIIHLATRLVKEEWKKEKVGHQFEYKTHKTKIDKFIQSLPFELTNSQKKVVDDILTDVQKPNPMNRFLQGDVGSGKTVVAAVAAYLSHLNGFQTLVMAPTEILAQQHYITLQKMLSKTAMKVALQTSSHKTIKSPSLRANVTQSPMEPHYDIIVGTHALLNQKLNFK
ncbi:DEAD/DEAH box helicase, partial [Candidatus Microgenomates bacterium]|nr:DEAD/DEAH box helicase [Candidatus Microgenomates bacterium]